MATKKSKKSGSLPTKSPSSKQIKKLTKNLLVTDKALGHLVSFGMINVSQIRAAGCCKPDGGTCCPNKGRSLGVLKK